MTVSIVFAREIVAELSHRRIDGQRLLRLCGIEPERLGDIHEVLRPAEYERLIRQAIATTGDAALGLAVGANSPDNAFQLFGHLLRVQPTIRDAFEIRNRYAGLIARGPIWQLSEVGDLAYVTLTLPLLPGVVQTFFMEHALTSGVRVGRSYFPRLPAGKTSLQAVHFPYERPSHADKYGDYFRCPVLFGQRSAALVFPRALLDRTQLHADPMVGRMLCEAADRVLQHQARENQWHERVRSLLHYGLELPNITATQVARHFKITPTTLRRRLASEGHTFSELMDEALCRLACGALAHDELEIREVSEMLGYSDSTAFFRAFKRWTGKTPGEFRKSACKSGRSDEHTC